ncbi:hypothetical protein [Prochlorococcus marinus]|uniref:hypothetical protein n=1 Tax=Prochlorococcus marinus TaxID=1219 RepID=UPI0022B463AC|nr:hypothetical protein [Prochlorococcus marinus]
MRIESKLCHISENKVVVKVTGWNNDKNLGSALAEGGTVEVAEDKAISRLNKRINGEINNEEIIKTDKEDDVKTPLKVELPKSNKMENIYKEPTDWSNILTAIDLEIQRLKWSRDDENIFLEKNLGYNNRNKITKYSDIVNYLSLLKKTDILHSTNKVNININKLIEESDSILRDLSWDNLQGREYLQREFNVSTRKELNEEQLISFIEKIKSIRNQ